MFFSAQGELSKCLSLYTYNRLCLFVFLAGFSYEFSNRSNLSVLPRRPEDPRRVHAAPPPRLWMHLAVVACGSRLEETLVMLKSAVLFSHRKMQFHIFTEESLQPEFDKQVNLQKS